MGDSFEVPNSTNLHSYFYNQLHQTLTILLTDQYTNAANDSTFEKLDDFYMEKFKMNISQFANSVVEIITDLKTSHEFTTTTQNDLAVFFVDVLVNLTIELQNQESTINSIHIKELSKDELLDPLKVFYLIEAKYSWRNIENNSQLAIAIPIVDLNGICTVHFAFLRINQHPDWVAPSRNLQLYRGIYISTIQ